MELRHLEFFVAVAEEQSFTKASTRLRIVQSGVSSAIKALEKDLGAALFDRSGRQIELTDAGAAFLPKARAALDAARDAREAVQEVRGGIRGTLRIGTLTAIDLIDLPALMADYHRRHPAVHLRLSAAPSGSAGLVDSLTEGKLDVTFVSMPGGAPPGIALRDLADAPLDLVVPAAHPLAARESVRLTDFADEPFVDFPDGYGNRAVTDRAFAAAGLQRSVSIEIVNIATGADFVRHGMGVALLPRFLIPGRSDLRSLPVTDADMRWPLSAATSTLRRPSAAARAFLALLPQHTP
ncbi:LysR family transcriptional regulator [Cryptosporangium arvum]|jgi:DNA-binding transcriptional LysR family regulator|uniref:Transcriptional regulator n=1 Tax=Cryptosporangium arvum DSM 44712 TaxID=927661 RepID=A0A011AF57_9ACTN|nr:LysR family transcriptional regulator [Cryptosporangium arvum]EXG80666.1 transcriptional regulator [Cryptosporangium arvum DSM 44712]